MLSLESHTNPHARPPIVVVGVEQEWAARALESVLGPHGFAVVRAYSGRQTLDLCEVAAPDVILLDSRLSDIDGVDACRRLRAEGRVGMHVPIVLMTSGPAPREFIRSAYQAGAWSVWEQPIDGELLLLRLETWVGAKRVADEAERLSLIDVASGLYTYLGLSRRAGEVMADAARRKTPVACVAFGSVLLAPAMLSEEQTVSARLASDIGRLIATVARGSDVIGRVGATEFTIIAPMTEAGGAIELVERVRDRVAELPGVIADGRALRVNVRAGFATVADVSVIEHDGRDLLARAATALRFAQAKRSADVRSIDEVPFTFV
jgi:PleD family two-component response regulator